MTLAEARAGVRAWGVRSVIPAIALLALSPACDGDATSPDATAAAEASGGSLAVGGGGSTSMGGTSMGGSPAAGGGGSSADGGGGNAPLATVPCAGGECASGQVCCFDSSTNTQVRCDAPGRCDGGQIELSCDHPDDCPGSETCCSAFDGMVQTMECSATCDAPEDFVMCSGPDRAACPPATTCSPAQAGDGYHYCRR